MLVQGGIEGFASLHLVKQHYSNVRGHWESFTDYTINLVSCSVDNTVQMVLHGIASVSNSYFNREQKCWTPFIPFMELSALFPERGKAWWPDRGDKEKYSSWHSSSDILQDVNIRYRRAMSRKTQVSQFKSSDCMKYGTPWQRLLKPLKPSSPYWEGAVAIQCRFKTHIEICHHVYSQWELFIANVPCHCKEEELFESLGYIAPSPMASVMI